MIKVEMEGDLYRVIGTKCVKLGCTPCAIGGTADHVHLLARLNPSISIARLVGEIKGSSSYAATHHLGAQFQWQNGYGAFSVSAGDLPAVERYVRDQKHHHTIGAIEASLEFIDHSQPASEGGFRPL
jgi:putative transposase